MKNKSAKGDRFDWKLTIKLNIAFLRIFGLWPNQAYYINFYTIRTVFVITGFFLVAVLCQLINIFFILNDLSALTGTIYILLTEMLLFFKICYIIKNTKRLKDLMSVLNCDLFQPKDANQIAMIRPNLVFWKQFYVVFMGACVGGCLFWISFPIVDKTLKKRLPFAAWYPYDPTVSPFYELTYFHQVISYTYSAFTHVNVDTLMAALNMYIASQFDLLCHNLRNLHAFNVKRKLVDCICHHRLILSFARSLNGFLHWIVFLQFTVSVIIIGMTLFQITIVPSFSTEFFSLMSYGISAVVQVFMYCWFGNEVQVKSRNVPYAAFQSDWTCFTVEMKKNLLFFIARSQKSVDIKAFKVFNLSLDSFKTIIKTAWSYFTLLRQVSADT